MTEEKVCRGCGEPNVNLAYAPNDPDKDGLCIYCWNGEKRPVRED